jgi:hypothetical protein
MLVANRRDHVDGEAAAVLIELHAQQRGRCLALGRAPWREAVRWGHIAIPAAHSAVVGVHTEVLHGKVDGEPEAVVMLKVGRRLHLHARTLRQIHDVLNGGA